MREHSGAVPMVRSAEKQLQTSNLRWEAGFMIAVHGIARSHDWIVGEPSLAEVLGDPLVHAILRRDGLTRQDLQQAIALGRRRLTARAPATSDAA
jgi:hypothetical protein